MPQVHTLKTWPTYFEDVVLGRKHFEYRKDDRGFEVHDILVLAEYRYTATAGHYTGKVAIMEVSYVLRSAPGLPEGYIVMGIRDAPVGEIETHAKIDQAITQVREAGDG